MQRANFLKTVLYNIAYILAAIGIISGLWLFSWAIMQVLVLILHSNIPPYILIPICAVVFIVSLAAIIACFEDNDKSIYPVMIVILFGLLIITGIPIMVFAQTLIFAAVKAAI